jgi:ubiquinone/menaquinone biosynthesis C-methylase UbiE
MNIQSNADVLLENLDLPGKDVIDVGCGEGGMVRVMTRAGARVIGVDCTAKQLEKAHAAEPAGDETYIDGVGEALPFDDASKDIVVYFNALHHVPMESQAEALDEVARVLKPGGTAYVAEPMAEGAQFDLVKLVHDETEVRAFAYGVLQEAGEHGLRTESEFVYLNPLTHKSFDQMKEKVLTVNPDRRGVFESNEAELRANYDRLGNKTDDGDRFDQPMRVFVLRKS